ncbi:cell wall metabolism sensor histidine kinase WalK [Geothrix sp. 21YS21S-4]|uniref:sensor histidine kinase n=1 Tax=Geothrix sp. 21YS21S-4 TaxID=3068889 RepID=UPI0027B90192|nr:HAMP domain-containing sensor histidine kinase [Geothrix sp. 21YS21S-4]
MRALICLGAMLFLGLGLGMSLHKGTSAPWTLGLVATLAIVVILMARWQVRPVAEPLGQLLGGSRPRAIEDLPRAWSALERENLDLRERAARDDRLLPSIMARLEEGVLLFGGAGRLEQFNPAAQRHLGLGAPLGTGMAVAEVLRDAASAAEVQKAYGGVPAEWRMGRAARILRVRAIPFAPLGTVSGVLLTLDDVTSQEALETTRQKFISNVSHELKTPVTALRIAAENLLDEPLDAPVRAGAESILRSVDRLTLLLGDLSELSRIESGALRLDPVRLDLATFIASLVKDQQERLSAADVALDTVVDAPEDAMLLADPLRLSQVLENLISNAIKFSPVGGRVKLAVRLSPQGQLWEVADQGPGIPEAELGRIFERFYRSQAAKAKPGTGLGLAIVKHLCRLMGGEVTVESRPGEGAVFRVMLPPVPAGED